jgi:regulator of replication initiation timing
VREKEKNISQAKGSSGAMESQLVKLQKELDSYKERAAKILEELSVVQASNDYLEERLKEVSIELELQRAEKKAQEAGRLLY